MARKGKRKKKLRKYNQRQFVEIICPQCTACADAGVVSPKPLFCYAELYRHEPKAFLYDGPLANLCRVSKGMKTMGRTMRSCELEQFRKIFCNTGVCFDGHKKLGETCDTVRDCFTLFREQLGLEGGHSGMIDESGQGTKYVSVAHKAKKGKKRYVAEAYPSSFMSSSEEFQNFVKKVLHGDNDSKSDNDQGSTSSSEGGSDNGAESGESKVSRSAGKGS